MGDNFSFLDPTTWWGDSSPVDTQPVEPTSDVFNQDYGTSSNTGVFPDGNGGYTDINGNAVDSTGQPIQYDSNGNQIDSNGNIVNQASPYQYTNQDQNIAPGGYDANGNPLDANGNPMSPQQQQQYQTRQQYNQQQGQQRQQQGGGGPGGRPEQEDVVVIDIGHRGFHVSMAQAASRLACPRTGRERARACLETASLREHYLVPPGSSPGGWALVACAASADQVRGV